MIAKKEIRNLSTTEKIILVQDLWDDIIQNTSNIQLTDAQKASLDEEYKKYLKDPQKGRSWQKVKDEVLKSL